MAQLSIGGLVLGQKLLIKSIQYGSISIASGSTSNTGAINEVDLDNSIIMFLGNTSAASALRGSMARVELTNSTTVTVIGGTSEPFGGRTARFCVLEFHPGLLKSNQSGYITIATSQTTNTDTISSVDTTKAVLFYLGIGTDGGVRDEDQHFADIQLTNSTTITATRDTADANETVDTGYQIIEFY